MMSESPGFQENVTGFSDRRVDRTDEPIPAVEKQLKRLVADGDLLAAVLAGEDGLTIVSSESESEERSDPEIVSALVGHISRIRGFAEVSFFKDRVRDLMIGDVSGLSCHCRFFDLMDQPVTLAIVLRNSERAEEILERGETGIRRIIRIHYLGEPSDGTC